MSISLLPCFRADALTQITPEFLSRKQIKLLMMDFDNTIVPYTTDVPTEEMKQWLEQMKESGIQLCVVSNSKKDRVKVFCKAYGLDCITHSRKPFPKGIRCCMEKYGIPAAHCGLVGDQIFTDTLGANACGVCSILIKAIHNHTVWLKLRHVAELPFIFLARKRRVDL